MQITAYVTSMQGQFTIFGDHQTRIALSPPTDTTSIESTPNLRVSLCEKYRPETLEGFVGLAKPKRLFRHFVAHPHRSAWLFLGPTGTGKTSFALAAANELRSPVHHLSARDLTRVQLNLRLEQLERRPEALQVVLIDEAENLPRFRQLYLRQPVDYAPGLIWIFTAVSAAEMDEGLSSRCMRVNFSAYGSASESAAYLERIWHQEVSSSDRPAPNFARIVKEAKGDMRTALTRLELLLL